MDNLTPEQREEVWRRTRLEICGLWFFLGVAIGVSLVLIVIP